MAASRVVGSGAVQLVLKTSSLLSSFSLHLMLMAGDRRFPSFPPSIFCRGHDRQSCHRQSSSSFYLILHTPPPLQYQTKHSTSTPRYRSIAMAFGGRLTVAAYAASFSLRSASAFSVNSSSPLPPGVARHSFLYKNLVMSASASSDADIDVDIAGNIAGVKQRIDDAISSNDRPAASVRLVAVSKTKPLELLQAAYEVR